jgi:hypothetical protein
MDKQSKLIFESYQSIAELVDLVDFSRSRAMSNSNTCFDVFTFKDKHNKKRYTLHQIVMQEDNRKPEICGTSIFDNARDTDIDGMIFHSIDKNVHLHGLGDLAIDSTIKNHKFFKEDLLGWEKMGEMVHKAYAMTEKQRSLKEYGMKPDAEDKFKDILSNLSEEVQSERFKILKLKIRKNFKSGWDNFTYEVVDKNNGSIYRIDSKDYNYGEIEIHLSPFGEEQLLATVKYGEVAEDLKSIPMYKNNRYEKDVKNLFALGKFLDSISIKKLKQIYFAQNLKPKTQEHFGDIFTNLSESVKAVKAGKFPKVEILSLWRDEDQYHQGTDEILFKVGNKYYLTREFYEEMPNVLVGIYYFENTKFKQQKDGTLKITNEGKGFHDFMGDRNRLKKWNDRSRQEVINFQHDPGEFVSKSYKHAVTSIDPDMVAINDFLLKFTERERQVYLLKIKPKTAEHFGDIMGGLS